jgi:hypothetical protein
VPVVGHELQLAPARHNRGVQSPRASEAFGRTHGLFGGLSVDLKNLGKSKDEIGLLIRLHESIS